MFTQPRSGSPAAPRNTALEHATGEYVIFLDSDDRIAEGSLLRLHDKIAARAREEHRPGHDERTPSHGITEGQRKNGYRREIRTEPGLRAPNTAITRKVHTLSL